MTTFSVAEGTLNLSDLIDRALRGEGVVVTRQGTPVVEIKAIQGATRSVSDADLAWLDERRITPRSGGETPSASLAAIREGYQLGVYLDASAIVPLFVTDAFTNSARDMMRTITQQIIISDWAALEFSNVIARQVRVKQVTQIEADTIIVNFDSWRSNMLFRADIESSDIKFATSLVRRTDLVLRGPDAVHIAIATRLNASLLTFDNAMSSAARALGLALTD